MMGSKALFAVGAVALFSVSSVGCATNGKVDALEQRVTALES
jgi:outer membrane murein-binding lipoprotein Lpp